MITVVAKVRCDKEIIVEVKQLLLELIEESNKEEGCIFYQLHEDINDDKILIILEEWKSEKDLKKHRETDHYRRIAPKIKDLGVKMEVNVIKKLNHN